MPDAGGLVIAGDRRGHPRLRRAAARPDRQAPGRRAVRRQGREQEDLAFAESDDRWMESRCGGVRRRGHPPAGRRRVRDQRVHRAASPGRSAASSGPGGAADRVRVLPSVPVLLSYAPARGRTRPHPARSRRAWRGRGPAGRGAARAQHPGHVRRACLPGPQRLRALRPGAVRRRRVRDRDRGRVAGGGGLPRPARTARPGPGPHPAPQAPGCPAGRALPGRDPQGGRPQSRYLRARPLRGRGLRLPVPRPRKSLFPRVPQRRYPCPHLSSPRLRSAARRSPRSARNSTDWSARGVIAPASRTASSTTTCARAAAGRLCRRRPPTRSRPASTRSAAGPSPAANRDATRSDGSTPGSSLVSSSHARHASHASSRVKPGSSRVKPRSSRVKPRSSRARTPCGILLTAPYVTL